MGCFNIWPECALQPITALEMLVQAVHNHYIHTQHKHLDIKQQFHSKSLELCQGQNVYFNYCKGGPRNTDPSLFIPPRASRDISLAPREASGT